MADRVHIPTFVPFERYYELEAKIAALQAENDRLRQDNADMRSAVRGALSIFNRYDKMIQDFESESKPTVG